MAFGITLRVWGPYACFTRPEMKVERVSYDVMTPSAARGILEAIYWKPSIRWHIKRIHVLKAIQFTNIRRNELAGTIPLVKAATMQGKSAPPGTFIEDDRQQRAALILKDVDYIIEAVFSMTAKAGQKNGNKSAENSDLKPAKHAEIITRRAGRGQCFSQPYFGNREFPVCFSLLNKEDIPESPFKGEQDLGYMLHDIDYSDDMNPHFFRAKMHNGIIDVPEFQAKGVRA